jgi:hypothetical protein
LSCKPFFARPSRDTACSRNHFQLLLCKAPGVRDTLLPVFISSIFDEYGLQRTTETRFRHLQPSKRVQKSLPRIEDFITYNVKRDLSSFFLEKSRFFAFFLSKTAVFRFFSPF